MIAVKLYGAFKPSRDLIKNDLFRQVPGSFISTRYIAFLSAGSDVWEENFRHRHDASLPHFFYIHQQMMWKVEADGDNNLNDLFMKKMFINL